jgi:glycosyltransferase involved in cell wall biosynthesis
MNSEKIALVHDWVEKYGGAEAVLDQLVNVFPNSDLFVLWNNQPDRYTIPTKESFLANSFLRNHKAASIPLQLVAWRSFATEPAKYEKIVVSSHLFAHHVNFRNNTDASKYVYVHTPARYIWEPERDSRGDRALFKLAAMVLKPIDKNRAQEATRLAANSYFTKGKILQAWGRDSEVIYPPVDVTGIKKALDRGLTLSAKEEDILTTLPEEFILGASRFVDYKRLDKVVELGEWLKLPVVLAGTGPLLDRFQSLAENSSVPVIVIDKPSDSLLLELFSRCLSYVFPPIEDFGVMPVEASAAGAAVLANMVGGASESIVEGINGALVDMDSRAEILAGFDRLSRLNKSLIPEHIGKFDTDVFRKRIFDWVR